MAQVIEELVLKVREQGLAGVNSSLEKLDANLKQMNTAAERTQKALGAGMAQATQQIQGSLSRLSAEAAKVQQATSGMTSRFAVTGKAIAQVNPSLTALSSNLGTTGTNIHRAENELRGFNREAARTQRAATNVSQSSTRASTGMARMAKEAKNSQQKMAALATTIQGLGARLVSMIPGAGLLAGALGPIGIAIGTIGATAGIATVAFARWEQRQLSLQGVLRATGQSAGRTSDQIRRLTDEIASATLATRQEVERAAQQILAFGNIAGENFDATLRAAQDLAALGLGSIESAAVTLAQALQNPAEELEALRSVGVRFTLSQRQLIKSLQDTGQTAQAQRVMLRALQQQVGGAGVAQGSGLTGSWQRLTEEMGKSLEGIGRAINQFVPLQKLFDAITTRLEQINRTYFPTTLRQRLLNLNAAVEEQSKYVERLRAEQERLNTQTDIQVQTARRTVGVRTGQVRVTEKLVEEEKKLNEMFQEQWRLIHQIEDADLSAMYRSMAASAKSAQERIAGVVDELRKQIELAKMTPLGREITERQREAGVKPDSPEGQQIADLVRELETVRQAASSLNMQAQIELQGLTDRLLGNRSALDELSLSWESYAQTVARANELIAQTSSSTHEAIAQQAQLEMEINRQKAQALWDTAKIGTEALASLFPKNKAFAYANAVVNTAEAITKALAAAPPPFNFGLAAAVAAAGAAQIAAIRSTNTSGGGGLPRPGAGGGVSPAPQGGAAAPPGRAVHIHIPAGDFFSREAVVGLIERLNEEVQNGAILISTRTIPM